MARVFSDADKRLVAARIRDGFSVADLKKAIDGNFKNPHHCGQNDTGTEYHDLELIFRKAAKVRQFMVMDDAKGPQQPQQQPRRFMGPAETRAQARAEKIQADIDESARQRKLREQESNQYG